MTGRIKHCKDGPRYFIDGKPVTKKAFDAAFPDKPLVGDLGGQQLGCWPMASEGAAVHPLQVGEAVESAKKRGVPTEFTSDGRPIFTGRDHRRRYLKAYAFHDRDGGFGDG